MLLLEDKLLQIQLACSFDGRSLTSKGEQFVYEIPLVQRPCSQISDLVALVNVD